MQKDRRFIILKEKNDVQSISRSEKKFVAMFSSQKRLNQETFSDRKFSFKTSTCLGETNLSEPFWLKIFLLVWSLKSLSIGVKCPARDGAQCKVPGRRHGSRTIQQEESAPFPRPWCPNGHNVNENESTRTLRWPTHVPV